jgi:glycosyltransferase involved in cell wall biosynthesis
LRDIGSSGIPRVSVCVPVYNGETFLAPALDSILAQTFCDYELVISDNASTDSTPEICKAYAARDPRIRYSRTARNIGANPNFNRLVGLARARYFKLANADDLCHPELLARCIAVLDGQPDVALCYGRTRLIDALGASLGDYEDRLDLPCASAPARFRAAVQRMALVNVLQGLVRTDVLARTRLLSSWPGADLILVAELALHGKFCEVPERLFFRRMHASAASSLTGWADRQAFVDPAVSSRSAALRTSRMHLAYLSAVLRAPLALRDRVSLFCWISRRAVWNRDDIAREVFQLARSCLRSHQA